MKRNGLCGAPGAIFAVATLLLSPAAAEETAATPANHHIKTVFIILMENRNWTGDGAKSIQGNPEAPYINNTLIPMSSYAEPILQSAPRSPEPAKLSVAGSRNKFRYSQRRAAEEVRTDHHGTSGNIAGQCKCRLESLSRGYDGQRFAPCGTAASSIRTADPLYAVRHEPFTYFTGVTDNLNRHSSYCIAHLGSY